MWDPLASEHLWDHKEAQASWYPLSHGICGMCARHQGTKENSTLLGYAEQLILTLSDEKERF